MRILFDNYTNSSALSAGSENSAYPVSNIKDPFLKKIFKSTLNTDVIEIIFPTSRIVDCCYLGLTNATVASMEFYNSSDVLIETKSIDPTNFGGIFALPVVGVKYVKLHLVAAAPVYIGNIGVGLSYKMPDPLNDVIKGKVDNSDVYISRDGQYSKNKIEWLRTVKTSHYVLSIDDYNAIYALFSAVDRPVWIDVYEELKNGILPLYAQVEFEEKGQSWHKYNFTIAATEAR